MIAILLLLISINLRINILSAPYLYNSISALPYNKVGLVPGTSQYIATGVENPYFTNRMDAAAKLYFTKKVSYLLLSGDNSLIYYNEPIMMKNALLQRGIPDSVIYLDYAGFRTLDAIVRAREIFGQTEFTVISQKFHNERALFIARKKGIKAVALNVTDVEGIAGLNTQIREVFAKVKAFIDLYILDKQPKFLGEKIYIGKLSD